jgi:hypothetical protein
MEASVMATTPASQPDYYASLAKQLQPGKPAPINTGPYLDQAGQMPIQSVMSPEDFQGSLGPAWDEFSKPGGYLDKAYQGQTQIKDANGNPMNYQQIADAVKASGHDFTPNPFLALPTLQGQLYSNVSKNVGNYYQQLQDALTAGRQDYEQRTAKYGQDIAGYFDQAGRDVSQFGQNRLGANQDFANSVGLGGTTGAGSQTSVLADQLARLGAINAVNKGNAQATFGQRRGIIDDLLQQRALAAATSGADTQSAIAQMAAQHWGLADPNQLYQQYMTNKSQADLAGQQMQLQLAQLQAQLAGAGSGGGGGGGGGRRGGGGGGGSATAGPGSWPPTYEEALAASGGDTNAADTIMVLSHPSGGLQQRLETYAPTPTVTPPYKGVSVGGRKAV